MKGLIHYTWNKRSKTGHGGKMGPSPGTPGPSGPPGLPRTLYDLWESLGHTGPSGTLPRSLPTSRTP